jgi:predicted nucleotidyltransferase
MGKAMTLEQIVTILRAGMPELQARYHVHSLGVFGSYSRGEQSAASDIDILVSFSTPPSLFGFVELEQQLSSLLGLKVDLVMQSALKPRIGRRVLEEVVRV